MTFEEVPPIPEDAEFLWRFEDRDSSTVTCLGREIDDDRVITRHGDVALVKCLITKETPKGYWVSPTWGEDFIFMETHFVLKDGKKRYAYPTIAEAWESYRQWKLKQIKIISDQLRLAQERLNVHESKPAEEYE